MYERDIEYGGKRIAGDERAWGIAGGEKLGALGMALLLMALWRRGAASARHLAWVTVFLCLLCLPGLVRFMPVWHPPTSNT